MGVGGGGTALAVYPCWFIASNRVISLFQDSEDERICRLPLREKLPLSLHPLLEILLTLLARYHVLHFLLRTYIITPVFASAIKTKRKTSSQSP